MRSEGCWHLLCCRSVDHPQRAQFDTTPTPTCSALWLAVDLGLEGITARLVEAGACRGSKGRWISASHPALSALALTAAHGHVALVDLLYPRVLEALQGEGGGRAAGRRRVRGWSGGKAEG